MYTDLMVPHLCSFAPQVCGNSPHMMLPQFRDAVGTTQLLGPVLVEFDLAHCFDVFSMAFLVNVGSNISQTNMELDSLKHLKQSQALRPCFSPSGQGECANLESKKPSRGRNWPWSSKNGLPLWLSSSVGRSAFPSSRVATTFSPQMVRLAAIKYPQLSRTEAWGERDGERFASMFDQDRKLVANEHRLLKAL